MILVTSYWSAPHFVHRSGSHSRTAKKHGHCLVLHWALHRHPRNCKQTADFSTRVRKNHALQCNEHTWKPILTVRTTLAKFFAIIGHLNTVAIGVTGSIWMITRNISVNSISSRPILDIFSAMIQPLRMLLFLLLFGRSVFFHVFCQRHVYGVFLGEFINLKEIEIL